MEISTEQLGNIDSMMTRRERTPVLSCYRDDVWQPVRVASGTDLLSLWPLESGYFFPMQEFERADGEAAALYRRLQIRAHPYFGYKPAAAVLRVTGPAPGEAVAAVRLNNPSFGSGGATMLRLLDTDCLELLEFLPLATPDNAPRPQSETPLVAAFVALESGTLIIRGDREITATSTADLVLQVPGAVASDDHRVSLPASVDGLGPSRIVLTWRGGRLVTASIMAAPEAIGWQHWSHEAGVRHIAVHTRALADWAGAGQLRSRGAIGLSRDPHNHCGSIEFEFRHGDPYLSYPAEGSGRP